jgi:hypothetical protein
MREVLRGAKSSRISVERGGVVESLAVSELMNDLPREKSYVAVVGYPLHAIRYLTRQERQQLDDAIRWATVVLVRAGSCLAMPADFLDTRGDRLILDFVLAQPNIDAQ